MAVGRVDNHTPTPEVEVESESGSSSGESGSGSSSKQSSSSSQKQSVAKKPIVDFQQKNVNPAPIIRKQSLAVCKVNNLA